MKSIAFAIQKGGTGKTTLAGNVAHALSRKRKTLIVDADPQGNLSSWLLKETPEHELADLLMEDCSLLDAVAELGKNLYILPTFSLDGNLQAFSDMRMISKPHIFEKLCRQIEGEGFDFAIVDLGPGMGLLEKYVILAMDEVITPLTREFFSRDGIEIFRNELRKINEDYERKVKHRKIVANMVNRSFRRHQAICEQFEQMAYSIFTVRQDSKIAESQIYHQSIFDYSPSSKSVPEIERIASSIEGGRKYA